MRKASSKIIVLFILGISLIAGNIYSQWVPTVGPGGRTVHCLTVYDNKLYAGVDNYNGGMFISSNNGSSWSPSGLMYNSVKSIIYSGTYLFAGTTNGVYLSPNGGSNWYIANNGFSGQVVEYFALNGSTIFAGTGSGIYMSTNQGGLWSYNALSAETITGLVTVGSTVYASTNMHGVYKTTNNGASWTQTTLNNVSVLSLGTNGTNIFAGIYSGVYVTANGGSTWTQTLNQSYAAIFGIGASGSNVIAGTQDNGIYRSTNSGSTWSLIPYNKYVQTIIFNGQTAFIGASDGITNGGVFRSYNYGVNWDQSGINCITIRSLTSLGSNIYAAGNISGVQMSANSGDTWNPANNGITNFSITSLASGGSYVFASTSDGGVFRTSNNGSSWTSSNTGLFNQNVNVVNYSGSTLFAGTYGAGMFRSTNLGDSWTLINTGLTSNNILSIATNGTKIVAGTIAGVFQSTNNGDSWTSIGLSSYTISSLTINGSYILASTYGLGIHRTSNGGGSWSLCGFSGTSVNHLLNYGTIIFAATGSSGIGNGIFMTTDYGTTWINRNQGFNYPPASFTMTIANNYLFVGNDTQSVWRRSLTDIIGIRSIGTEIPSSLSLHQNYPNPFNPVTNIKFEIPEISDVKITVYDIAGREVEMLVNEKMQPGIYQVTWNGDKFSSGTYFCKMHSGNIVQIKKMVLIK